MSQDSENKLRIVSVNIEKKKHLETVTNFLEKEQPNVICLQEVHRDDVNRFTDVIGGEAKFVPMFAYDDGQEVGIAIVSNLPFTSEYVQYAGLVSDETLVRDKTSFETMVESEKYFLLRATVSMGNVAYEICTTHMPVTKNGEVTEYQVEAINNLMTKLDEIGDFVMLGDLNAPRGQQSFSLLAERYIDNVPEHYDSSLDPEKHRAGHLKRMVDGCFSTKLYSVKETRFQCGISDHCALCVEVTKNS